MRLLTECWVCIYELRGERFTYLACAGDLGILVFNKNARTAVSSIMQLLVRAPFGFYLCVVRFSGDESKCVFEGKT